jgi:CDP-diglyceride synthetase
MIIVLLIAIILSFSLLILTKGSTAHDMMACLMTVVYCGLIMGAVISIVYMTPESFSNVNETWGRRSFAYLISIVVSTDTFAYFVGTKFGKHKLCPEISPKKSVEGAIGGLVAGALIGTILAFVLKIVNLSVEMIIGVLFVSILLSIAVQIGDLIASKLKRSYGIKDFGKIFPGHGGVLDRFDSILFSGIVFYTLIQIIELIGM